jgi:hypothetical protein
MKLRSRSRRPARPDHHRPRLPAHHPAIAAQPGEADIIEHNVDHVRGAGRRLRLARRAPNPAPSHAHPCSPSHGTVWSSEPPTSSRKTANIAPDPSAAPRPQGVTTSTRARVGERAVGLVAHAATSRSGKRRQSGSLKQFLIAFVSSSLIGYLVNLMLVWRVLAVRALTERLGEAFIPGVRRRRCRRCGRGAPAQAWRVPSTRHDLPRHPTHSKPLRPDNRRALAATQDDDVVPGWRR